MAYGLSVVCCRPEAFRVWCVCHRVMCVYVNVCGNMLCGAFRCAAAQFYMLTFRQLLAAEFASRNCTYTAAVLATE